MKWLAFEKSCWKHVSQQTVPITTADGCFFGLLASDNAKLMKKIIVQNSDNNLQPNILAQILMLLTNGIGRQIGINKKGSNSSFMYYDFRVLCTLNITPCIHLCLNLVIEGYLNFIIGNYQAYLCHHVETCEPPSSISNRFSYYILYSY